MNVPRPHPADSPIGVFDSGVGGLSVLRHIRAQLPAEHLLYFADTGHAPYGDKTEAFVVARALAVTAFLLDLGAKALVVACNTATVAAIKAVRARYPQLPVVGVEPGLKPAAAASRNGKVGVLATARTLKGDKFLQLREQVTASTGATFLLQPAVGLVDQIELGDLQAPAIAALLEQYVAPLLDQGADTLVLGCTHYPFVRSGIEQVLAAHGRTDVALIDTGDAVARQLVRLLDTAALLRPASPDSAATLHGYTTARPAALSAAFRALLDLDPPVAEADV
ncbi:glutamate racemase [Duganella sp. Leaf126]|uniref:glutamate racemase n=1 Tax=Duganella sp. Leaf126 TaxID=1736266 RepID=UPI0006FFCFF9|nr:glutamate racemase [Duganella sp. Leaf126]KQQ45259.1 glutamate racemase [Duganella sp. Leaf126]